MGVDIYCNFSDCKKHLFSMDNDLGWHISSVISDAIILKDDRILCSLCVKKNNLEKNIKEIINKDDFKNKVSKINNLIQQTKDSIDGVLGISFYQISYYISFWEKYFKKEVGIFKTKISSSKINLNKKQLGVIGKTYNKFTKELKHEFIKFLQLKNYDGTQIFETKVFEEFLKDFENLRNKLYHFDTEYDFKKCEKAIEILKINYDNLIQICRFYENTLLVFPENKNESNENN